MNIQNSSGNLDSLLLQLLPQKSAQSSNVTPPPPQPKKPSQDIVSLSGDKPNNSLNDKKSFTLSSETKSDVENGYRREQEFTKGNKRFTRIEEVTTTPERSKKITIQQNESGSITALENILDRQEDGTFRLTQRYTNEVGETKTNIELNFNPKDADILLGRPPSSSATLSNNPFQQLRGTQVDLSA